jgi:histidine ammonia-lyase
MHLTAQDLLTAAHWMEVRKAQDPSRSFGKAPTDALAALRKVVPFDLRTNPPDRPIGEIVYEFLQETASTTFYPGGPAQPAAGN